MRRADGLKVERGLRVVDGGAPASGLRQAAVQRGQELGIDGVERRADLPDGDEGVEQPGAGPRGRRLEHLVAEAREQICGVFQGGDAIGVHGCLDRRLGGHRDSETAGRSAGLVRERSLGGRRPPGIARLVAGQDVEQRGGVCDGPGDRPGGREALERRERRCGDSSSRRLEAEDAAAGGGNPDRSASVGAVCERHEPGRQGGGSSSTGPTGRALRIPRIPGHAVELGLRECHGSELRRVRLAEEHESGVAQPSNDRGVEVGHVVGERAARVRRTNACGRREVLDCDRDASKRAIVDGGICCSRVFECLVTADGDERVQDGVESGDALEVELRELDCGEPALSNEARLLGGREERKAL